MSSTSSSISEYTSTRPPTHATDIPSYTVGQQLVGSPKQDNGTDIENADLGTPRARPASALNEPVAPLLLSPGRSGLEHRSASSPLSALTTTRSRSNTVTRLTSGLMSIKPGTSRAPHEQHQWSLFEQLMENEGQLRSTTPRRVRNVPSRSTVAASRSSTHGGLSAAASVSESYPDSIVQSPVDDRRASEHYFDTRHRPNGTQSVGEISTEYDSDTSGTSDLPSPGPVKPSRPILRWYSLKLPTLSTMQRNVLKCGLAYFLASLFTFAPYLSGWISKVTSDGPAERFPSPSGHMVATVAVYFNPAKTIGGMVEADKFCFMGLFFAAFVCLGSMGMYWQLEVKPGWEWLADVLVILWIGIGMSAVAWMKVWMAKPSFNTACSMTAIILFVVIVKEGGIETLLQVSFIVIIGAILSNFVCYVVWPQSATTNLQDNMTKTLDSFSTLLQMLTNTFLLEEPLHQPSHEKLQRAVESHQASFTGLKKSLVEAHAEWFCGGPSGRGRKSSGRAYEDAVDSLTRLAQHLNGLRSGTRLQYELTKAQSDGKVVIRSRGASGAGAGSGAFASDTGKGKVADGNRESTETDALLSAAAVMFGDLVDDLGPPLKALTSTCAASLKRLREAFMQRRRTEHKQAIQPQEFHELVDGIERALYTFESTSNHAVMRLYRKSNISVTPSRSSLSSLGEESPMLTNGNNEHVFLVYFFIFTLQEFARELVSLVDAMGRVYTSEQEASRRGFWRKVFTLKTYTGPIGSFFWPAPKTSRRQKGKKPGLRRRLSAYVVPEGRHKLIFFPKVQPHAPNTVQTPGWDQLTFMGKVEQTLWTIGARLKERNLKYGIKAGMATAMLAAPAFFDATRPVFMEYRGEWALISFFVVISPTIGATNFLSVHRVLGTLFGAAAAAGIYTFFSENPVVLSIFGLFYSLPCFYYIVAQPQYATTARFVLLTYNLTCLYCYNLRQRDISVFDVALHRSVAVTVGVVWAALVSRFWWPSEARRELSKALGDFCVQLGWLYTRLVASNSFAPELQDCIDDPDSEESPLSAGTSISVRHATARTKLSNSIQEFMAMELHLQIKLIELQGLLAQTQHEPRLKGPFPVKLYRNVLTSLQTILDKLHSMRCVTTREEWYTSVREDFIIPVNRERHEMVGNIILYFSTLASAFRLKAPLPPYLPPAEKSRQRLVDAIRNLDIVKNRDVKGSKQLLFFAYALTMQGVTQELEKLGSTLQNAFGVIGQTPEEFEALFRDEGRRVGHTV